MADKPILFSGPMVRAILDGRNRLPALEYRAHKNPCKHCPSAYGPGDPESEWVLTLPHDKRVAMAFPCGWNGNRFCKGYCDVNGVTDADLEAARHLFR